jgi:cytosine/adenosine deaminase-related metal-dependent hydrolase
MPRRLSLAAAGRRDPTFPAAAPEPTGGAANGGDRGDLRATGGGTDGETRPNRGNGGREAAEGGRADATAGGGGEEPDATASGGAEASPPFTRVTCGVLAGSGDCTLSGAGVGLVLRGNVLTPGTLYEGGSVRLDASGVIRCVGCDCASADARELSCPDAVIGPGFVNPHDHVAYAAEGPRPPAAERYEHRHDWRLGLRGHTAITYAGGAAQVVRAAQELRMLLGGATSIAGGAGHAGLLRNPDLPDLTEGLPTAPAASETFPLDDADGRLLASGCDYGRYHATSADVEGAGAFLAHLGEGIDAEAENELACAGSTAFDLIQPSTAVVHAVAVRAREAAALGARHALVVWSPRSNLMLYGNTAPVPLLLRSGVEVALGTDWLLSGSMNLERELDCARRVSSTWFGGALDDHELWSMVTTAAARAVGAEHALGRLAPGYLADVSVVAQRGREPFAAATAAGAGDFELILRGGTPLYGRSELVAALSATSCEPLAVCGAEQRVCLEGTGFSLADLEQAAAATYPLFTCDTPPNEPACVPARPLEYDGVPSSDDRDGDGIANDGDLCPDVFDPLRPLDAGLPADADADGLGDACDPCPLDPDQHCREQRKGDRDGDGVANGADVCPDVPDPGQDDADGDGRGDVCDFCPAANPGVTPCPLRISAVRDPESASRPPRHALLALDGATVTALRPDVGNARGFYVEDAVAPFSGLFVYTAKASPGVVAGERVALRGRFDAYYGVDQLVLGAVLAREAGPAPEPLGVITSDLGDGGALTAAYDSMLVRVTDATVVATNPDAPSDYDETALDGGLRLDDLLYPELDNVFTPGTRFTTITGILGHSFEHAKLWPQGAEALVPLE